jgi:hypothetical protein
MKKLFLLILCIVSYNIGYGQVTIKGHVINERNESVEYVSIGFEEDSVGTISDAKGNFTIKIPANRKTDLSFSHVSYLTTEVPYKDYAKGNDLTVVLKDKVVKLAEVVVGKNNKPSTITGRGISAIGDVGFRGKGHLGGAEFGPTFKNKKDYVVSDILLTVKKCTFNECTLSFNIYQIKGKQFVNILNKPIYKKVMRTNDKVKLDVIPDETIVLKGNTKYYISFTVVDSDGYGIINFPSMFRTSYARRVVKGKQRKLPIGPAIIVNGYEPK